MTSHEIDLVAIISPKEGKVDREHQVVQLLESFGSSIQKNEPGALKFQIHREVSPSASGSDDIVMIEKYANQSAYDNHPTTPEFQNMVKTLIGEDLLAAPMVSKTVRPVGGFASRELRG
ncbi:MAG: hypothetical protein M1827_004059 [Pycnora praestabilis]|nr:MAG: hypothetical protein M1827_004059 [Pycnora praestabilis]